jgi:hypothetical protein
MKARDERVALMNEILGAIRMLKVRCQRSLLSHSLILFIVYGLGAQLRKEGTQGPREGIEVPGTPLQDRNTVERDMERVTYLGHLDCLLALCHCPTAAADPLHCLHIGTVSNRKCLLTALTLSLK